MLNSLFPSSTIASRFQSVFLFNIKSSAIKTVFSLRGVRGRRTACKMMQTIGFYSSLSRIHVDALSTEHHSAVRVSSAAAEIFCTEHAWRFHSNAQRRQFPRRLR